MGKLDRNILVFGISLLFGVFYIAALFWLFVGQRGMSLLNFVLVLLLLGVLVLAALFWLVWNFLVWQWFIRKGVLIEGRIEAQRRDSIDTSRGKKVVSSLEYSFDYNETNFLQSQTLGFLDLGAYHRLKEGDRGNVWLIPGHPTMARIEETSAFMTLMRKYRGN